MTLPLLTTEEVAERLRVDVKTVRALVDDGKLAMVRFGKRCVRFDPRDVDACIEGAKTWESTAKADTGISTSSSGGVVTLVRRARRTNGALKPLSERDDLKPQPGLVRTRET